MAEKQQRQPRSERARRALRRLAVNGAPALKRETFYALENLGRANWPGKIIGSALFVLILLNGVVVFVSTQPGLDPIAATTIQVFYKFSTLCFFIEYVARIWIANLAYSYQSAARARLHYIFSPLGIIDFLSFGPNMVSWFVPITPALLNIINVVRLVRLVKISRYMRGLRTIGRVIMKHYHEIVAAFLVIGLLVILSSVIMYEIENPAQPTKFNSLLSGVYWAVTTITGTGYGDLVPITPAGRSVGCIIMLLSVALVAIPGGIFSAGFVAEFQNANLRKLERDVRRSTRNDDMQAERVDDEAEVDDKTAEKDDAKAEVDDARAEADDGDSGADDFDDDDSDDANDAADPDDSDDSDDSGDSGNSVDPDGDAADPDDN